MFRFRTFLFCCFVLLFSDSFAQKQVTKVSLSGALLGDYSLIHESVISKNSSIQIKVGYFKPTLSPFVEESTITPEAFTLQDTKGGMNVSLEYRFYVSKKEAPNGLYLAPYVRYFNQSAMYADEIDNDQFDVDTKLSTIGIGAQLGYQLIISEVFTIDFSFFGAGIDHYGLKMKYGLQQSQPGFDYNSIKDDVSDVFTDINYLEERLEHEVSSDNLTSKLPFLFPGFRMGIHVGIAF